MRTIEAHQTPVLAEQAPEQHDESAEARFAECTAAITRRFSILIVLIVATAIAVWFGAFELALALVLASGAMALAVLNAIFTAVTCD